ncbi:MICOS complex subunit Mic60-like, partial [Phymastichus coffea]|uniref:MICOS complex subunit Mic60-like n=1 Tax=Phymastichus coffea TaxID=108790 RepID=UPI00273BEF96
MFRVGVKIPVNGLNLNRIKKHGCERLYLAARSYETRPKIKCDDRVFKEVTLASRLSGHRYSTESGREKSRGGTGTLVTLGAVTIGAIGILTYAKSDEKFRATLDGWIPGTNRAIQIIFQEESSYFDFIISFFESLKNKISNMIFGESTPKPGQIIRTVDCSNLEDFTPPRPAFTPAALELSPPKPPSIDKPKPELRISKNEGKKIEVVSEKPVLVSKVTPSEQITADLHELEKYGGELASKAIAAFQEASCAVQDFNQDVMSVVESSDSTVGNQIWDRLKVAQEKRSFALEEAEKKADEAVETLKKLHNSIDDPKVEATPGQKTIARRNINKILSELDEAKKKFDQEIANANITEKYWKSVKVAREKFHEELQILFPGINTNNKKLAVTDEAFDLFALHMYRKVAFLQKEFERLQTVADAKLKAALKSGDEQEKINIAVELALAQEKQKLREDFEKK